MLLQKQQTPHENDSFFKRLSKAAETVSVWIRLAGGIGYLVFVLLQLGYSL